MLPINRKGDKRRVFLYRVVPLQTSWEHTPMFEVTLKLTNYIESKYVRDKI